MFRSRLNPGARHENRCPRAELGRWPEGGGFAVACKLAGRRRGTGGGSHGGTAESEYRSHVSKSSAAGSATFAVPCAAVAGSAHFAGAAVKRHTDGQENHMGVPRYRVLVLIGWRIRWQAVGSFLLLLFVANLVLLSWLPELTRTGPSLWALLLPLITVTGLVAFLIMPSVVRALLNKSFAGVRLRAVSDRTVAKPSEPLTATTTRRRGYDTCTTHRDSSYDPQPESYGSVRGTSPGR